MQLCLVMASSILACLVVIIFKTVLLPVTATIYPRPTWGSLFSAFSKVENKVCTGNSKDGGCSSCTSCFYMDVYTSTNGKTFTEAQVRIFETWIYMYFSTTSLYKLYVFQFVILLMFLCRLANMQFIKCQYSVCVVACRESTNLRNLD